MANTPKVKDPTEAALSAIQEAISVRDVQPTPEPALTAVSEDEVADRSWFRRRNQEQAAQTSPVYDDDVQRPEQTSLRRPAANDDRESIGQMLQSLQHRPSARSYVIATAFAAVWAIAGLALGFFFRSDLQATIGAPEMSSIVLIVLGGIVLTPIIFFYMLAHMASRAYELRLITQSMAQLALRLSEPESAARDSVVSVGQAIRREVAAMGDGVERALARAGELEALVSNEVSHLERAYNDNEVRMRSLLQDLATQRETLVGQAEQMRTAISSIHVDLGMDITQISDLVNERIQESAQRVAATLSEKGEHITRALGQAGDAMIQQLGERGGDILERLEVSSETTGRAIATATDNLTASLNFNTDNINVQLESLANHLQQSMTSRLDQVTDNFAQRAENVIEMMGTRSQQLTETIVDTGTRLSEVIATRIEEANNTLRSTGDSLVLDLSLRGGEVVANLEQTGTRITDTIADRTDRVAMTFRESAQNLADSIGTRGDAIREMLAARLQSFEEMFNHGGAELAERIGRDSTTLGTLITRHLGEFDRTVKTYGGELVDRLSERTQEVSEAIRNYVDNFDSRVGVRTAEVTNNLDLRLNKFQETLDSRTESLNAVLGERVLDIAKTIGEGGKEVVGALDKRIADVTNAINVRGAKLAETVGAKIEDIDRTLGARAVEVANTLDNRLGRFEDLLVGRAAKVTEEIESRTKAAADLLSSRLEQLNTSITNNAGDAERALGSLALNTGNTIRVSAQDAEKRLIAISTGVSSTLRQSASEVERSLLGVSAEVARNFVGKAEEITVAITERTGTMTRVLDESSEGLLAALSGKSQEFASEVGRVTDHAVKAIEAKGFTFTRSMMDNSEEIARLINEASENATGSVTRSLKDLQAGAEDSARVASASVTRAMKELQDANKLAVEQSKQTATAAVSEMLETHGMLRSDTTVLFERLREANILLQEVLSGAHENMSAIESTLVGRVSDFVTAMNTVAEKSGVANEQMEQQAASFKSVTSKVLGDLSQLAVQFEMHGRSLSDAVALVDASNRRSDDTLAERRVALDSLVATLDIRTEDLDQRLKRLSGLLDKSLEGAADRARDIAAIVAETTTKGTRSLAEQFEQMRSATEGERARTTEAMRKLYEQATGEAQSMLQQSASRFTEIVDGLRQMSGEMQRELDSTRQELRRGILELPQETAESASQMRRVIVDQIEALAELNRIVARHGRGMDTVEPAANRRTAQREEPAYANAVSPAGYANAAPPQQRQLRMESSPMTPPPVPQRRAEAPSLSPAQGTSARSGWLTDLLTRASREDAGETPPAPPAEVARDLQAPPSSDERPARHSIESLDSLSVDIARMIDHDVAAELWDRYKRGERNVFTRRLYTMQGQKAFDDIRKRYRGDREFRQTVDRYIGEFERLLDEVSRDDRGQVVVRTYLTSETGKVYTMLAHAAGRFD